MNHFYYIKKIIVVCCFALFFSCGKKPSNTLEYSKDKHGFYYKLLAIGDGKQKPKNDQVIEISMVMKTQSDSVFWDTYHDAQNGFYIALKSEYSGRSFHSYLSNLVEGDSVSFLVNPVTCFKEYFDSQVPYFCAQDSAVKIDIKINQILSQTQYLALKNDSKSNMDLELKEKELIQKYLTNQYPSAQLSNGVYILEKLTTQMQKVSLGNHIKISYQGFLLDGKPVDITGQQLEFIYGTPDQLIKGLNIVIGTLKKGEFTKIIIPSHLAFGAFGNSNGSIPPYTPLVYNIKLIDIK